MMKLILTYKSVKNAINYNFQKSLSYSSQYSAYHPTFSFMSTHFIVPVISSLRQHTSLGAQM